MLSTVINTFDDVARAALRLFGVGTTSGSATAGSYASPVDLVNALHNPATEPAAVARMHKMHYGAFYGKDSRGMFSSLAENELLRKGKGFGGAVFGRPIKGISVGISHFKGAAVFALPQGIFMSALAPKGHKVSALVGGAARGIFYGVGDLIGTAVGGPLAGFALGATTEKIGGVVQEALQRFHDFNHNMTHINMGGNYEDTRIAYTMRQRAAQEMGSSVMNARKYLGAEALLMHQ